MDDIFEELAILVGALMVEHGIPGVGVGISWDGQRQTAGYGVTSHTNPLPVTPETLFQIGSISKTVTATAVMRLVESGQLALDAPLHTYVPEFTVQDDAVAGQATVRHLLTHTAGWEGDVFTDTGAGDDAMLRYVQEMARCEQIAPLGFAPSYCNSGFILLGHVVERVLGTTIEAHLQEELFAPLGMSNSFFFPRDVMVHRFAVGHHKTADGPVVAQPWPIPRNANAAGGICCALDDLLALAEFHMGDGTVDGQSWLAAETLADMQRIQAPVASFSLRGIGLSWFVDEIGGRVRISHGGGTNGQVANLQIIPEADFALAIVTNSGEGGRLIMPVIDFVTQALFAAERPKPVALASEREHLAEFVGTYSRPFADLLLEASDEGLTAQVVLKRGFPDELADVPPPTPKMPVARCGDSWLLVLDGPYRDAIMECVRREDGSIGWMRVGMRLHRRQKGSL